MAENALYSYFVRVSSVVYLPQDKRELKVS